MVQIENGDVFNQMASNLNKLNGHHAEVGYFAGESTEDNGTDTAAVALFQEFGTSRGIPSRPFLRQTMNNNSSDWVAHSNEEAKSIMLGGGGAFEFYDKIGKEAVQDIRNEIAKGDFAPLSPATIAQKGHAKSLVDTGKMFSATNSKVF